MSYHLRLFGHPALLDADGAMHRFRSRKQLALLVYLTLEAVEDPVERGVLIDFFWADVPLQKGRHSLSQALTAIRSLLGAEALPREPGPVRLSRPPSTDLDILRGELDGELANLQLPLRDLEQAGGAAFADWLDQAREHCLGTARRSLSGRLRAARSSGDVHRVHERAAQLYAVDPLNEMAVCALAEQLLMDGDVAGTQDFLRSHISRARARWELPPPAVVHLLERVETGRIRPPGGELLSATSSGQGVPQLFVGRSTELARLESLWADARRGRLVTCLVTGLAGIGKSSLLRRFAISVAARAAAVWEVACQEIGRSIPFAAISDLIHSVTRDSAVTGTSPDWLAEASRVCPGLREVYSGMPEPPPTPAESVRLRVAEALVQMQAAAADGGPMLFAIDDIANLDAASRDVLHVFLRRLQDVPVLVVAVTTCEGTCSSTRVQEDHRIWSTWGDSITLQPMTQSECHELVRLRVQGSVELEGVDTKRLLELAGGNPQLIELLLRDFRESGERSLLALHSAAGTSPTDWQPPEILRSVFRRQFGTLDRAEIELLNLLAVAGRALSVTDLRATLDLAISECDRALLGLLRRELVRVESGDVSMPSALHRNFVYGVMSSELRKFYHAKVAHQLTESGSPKDFQRLLEASYHFLRSSMLVEAVDAVLVGAESAIAEGAANEAEEALRSVLLKDQVERPDSVQLMLAKALSSQGMYCSAIEALEVTNPTQLGPQERVQRAILRAECLHRGRLGHEETIKTAVHEAWEFASSCGTLGDRLRALQLNAELASESGDQSTLSLVDHAAKRIRAGCIDPTMRARATLSNAYCLLTSGQARDAEHEFERCISALRSERADSDLRRALNGRAICQLSIGYFQDALASLQEAAEIAERFGDADGAANSLSNLGSIYEDLGDFERAAERYESAALAAASVSSPRRLAEVGINLTGFALSLGLVEQASMFAEWAQLFCQEARQWRLQVDLLNVRADCELAQGRPDVALELINEVADLTENRIYLLGDMGRHERLRRIAAWHNAGAEGLRALVSRERLTDRCPQVADELEVLVFEGWALSKDDGGGALQSALARVRRLGLHGIPTRLQSLGILTRTRNLIKQGATELQGGPFLSIQPQGGPVGAVSRCLSLAERLHSGRMLPPMLGQTESQNTASVPL